MEKFKIFLLLSVAILVLSGCFEVNTVVKLKKNGSGTMEETVMFSQMMVMQMAQMGQAFGGEEEDGNSNTIYDVEKLKAEAAEKGEGVSYVSSEAIDQNGKTGYKVIYKFNDINTLKLANDPSTKLDMPNMGMAEEKDEFVRFQYKKGELTINFPTDEGEMEDYEDVDEDDVEEMANEMEGMEEMMKQMFADMKFKTSIEFAGNISKTNATYVDGNTITLIEMDFNKIMEDPSAMKAMKNMESKSKAEQKKVMKNLPGIKVETEYKVTVKF